MIKELVNAIDVPPSNTRYTVRETHNHDTLVKGDVVVMTETPTMYNLLFRERDCTLHNLEDSFGQYVHLYYESEEEDEDENEGELQMKKKNKVVLGETYKDNLHGFVGKAIAKVEYLHGCSRVLLEKMKDDGELKNYWFDTPQVEGLENTESKWVVVKILRQ